jgi:ketosteroid isomerase-like protein
VSPEPNAEIVRRGYEAFNRGDLESVLELLDPQVRVDVLPESPMSETYHGHAGFLKMAGENAEMFERYSANPEDVIELDGEHIVVLIRSAARGRMSGVEIEGRLAHLWTIRDGKAVRFESFRTEAEARAAAGAG